MSLPNHIRHRTVFSMRPLVLETTSHEMPTRVGDVTFEVVGAMQFERQHTLRTAMDGGGKAQESFMQAAQQEHALNEQQCAPLANAAPCSASRARASVIAHTRAHRRA